jgi:hypothetical protein
VDLRPRDPSPTSRRPRVHSACPIQRGLLVGQGPQGAGLRARTGARHAGEVGDAVSRAE